MDHLRAGLIIKNIRIYQRIFKSPIIYCHRNVPASLKNKFILYCQHPIDYLLFSLQYMGLYVFNWPISVLGYWKDISVAHVIIIIKSKVSTFPIVIIFSVVVCLRCLLHHILSLIAYTFRENREFIFIIIVQFIMSANIRIRFGLQIVLVCLYSTPSHYHHCANLSEGIEFIKCLSDIFCWVCE